MLRKSQKKISLILLATLGIYCETNEIYNLNADLRKNYALFFFYFFIIVMSNLFIFFTKNMKI